jgi:thiaminase
MMFEICVFIGILYVIWVINSISISNNDIENIDIAAVNKAHQRHLIDYAYEQEFAEKLRNSSF